MSTIPFFQACNDDIPTIHLRNSPLPALEREDYRHFYRRNLNVDSEGILWGVSDEGTVDYYDSSTGKWHVEYTGAGVALEALYSTKQDKWVVGQNGTIMHYDSLHGQWQREESHTHVFLADIDGYGNDIWAVGNDGVILHYDLIRREWEMQHANTNGELHTLAHIAGDEWIGGDSGIILHWNSDIRQWEKQEVHDRPAIYTIAGSGDNIWAAGSQTLHYNRRVKYWESLPKPPKMEALLRLYPDSTGFTVVGLFGTVEHYDRSTRQWELIDSSHMYLENISRGSNQIWAWGDVDRTSWTPRRRGLFLFDPVAKKWDRQIDNLPKPMYATYQVNGETWLGGVDGVILHYDKNQRQWQREQSPTRELLSFMAGTGNEIWLTGRNGTIIHHDPVTKLWELQESHEKDDLGPIVCAGDAVWTIGESGVILKYEKPKRRWIRDTAFTGHRSFLGLYNIDNEIWITGKRGLILYHNLQTGKWKRQETATVNDLIAIREAGGELWAIGDKSTLLRYDRSSGRWMISKTCGSTQIFSVYGQGKDVLAAGKGGMMFHGGPKDKSWRAEVFPLADDLHIIYFVDNLLWVLGKKEILLSSDGYDWARIADEGDSEWLLSTGKDDGVWVGGENGLAKFNYSQANLPGLEKYTYSLIPLLNPSHLKMDFYVDSVLTADHFRTMRFSLSGQRADLQDSLVPIDCSFKLVSPHCIETSIDLEPFNMDYASQKFDRLKLQLTLQYLPDNLSRVFPLLESSTRPYLTISNAFAARHQSGIRLAKICTAVALYYLLVLAFSFFFPIAFLSVYMIFPIDTIVNKLPVPFNWVLYILNIFLPLSFFSQRSWVLDAWTRRHGALLKEKFYTSPSFGNLDRYIPVPVRLINEAAGTSEVIELPNEKLTSKLIRPDRTIIQLIGDGGFGKTRLTLQFCEWLTMLPILVDFNTTDLFAAVKTRLKAWMPDEGIPDDFLRTLFQRQRMMIVVDALSELDSSTQEYIDGIHGSFPEANCLMISSRRRFTFLQQPSSVVETLPLTYTTTQFFLDHYVSNKQSAYAPSGEKLPLQQNTEKAAFALKIFELFGIEKGVSLPISPLLIKISTDSFFESYRLSGGTFEQLINQMPSNVPDIYYQYLQRINPRLEATPNYLSTEQMYQVVELLGAMSLGHHFVPQDIDGYQAISRIRKEIPELDAMKAIHRLIENKVIFEKNSLSMIRLRFYFDTLAEYVAAVYYYKQLKAGHLPSGFTTAGPDNFGPDSSGFLFAFREIRRYYE